MQITINGTAEEIAALVLAVQERQPVDDTLVDEIWQKAVSHLEAAYSSCGKR